ncbi:hypothetical protein DFH07DRAFT_972754 [Mycena maculata]|uniref:Glycosyl transferase CAP10 domain-containing protein n=1 Tax=Mycena maculata TaxID=230809 RepID=A0AAD7HG29_9AGAR|nr:hypothetical protein DFH07DRAFT_972754 [Mycena maculata]
MSDQIPFEHSPHPTASFFEDEMKCMIPTCPKGFTGLTNDANAFILYSSSTQFTTDPYPLMSMAKISSCFADILVPSEFYYSDLAWTSHYLFPNNINWTEKIWKLYWHGMSSGGITGASSPREEVYKYKYVFDVDGNSFSGRYLGLLQSRSLVFKLTVFVEYFNGWLCPFEHYIPILPDLSDLVEKLECAVAQAIQGREWACLQALADDPIVTE